MKRYPTLLGSILRSALLPTLLGSAFAVSHAQDATPTLKIKADDTSVKVSPLLYGLMTEEINYSYEGGLYGELVRNRSFRDDATKPLHWSLIPAGGTASIALDTTSPLNAAQPASLKLDATGASADKPVGIANEGYWGIPVKASSTYRASFYARAAAGFSGPLKVAITSNDGKTTFASGEVTGLTDGWKKYEVSLTTGDLTPSKDNQFVITTTAPGTVWFSVVSLFPPTFNDRPNGNRPDLMQLMAEMHPAFLRFPGGNYLEGNVLQNRFPWKETLGDISTRPGHLNDGWKYWSNDGMGLLEFLNWCEDLHMKPLLAVYAGYSMFQQRIKPGPDLDPYVQDALDEIEYVTGGPETKWGAQRAKDGHPEPFKLEYVEIGNEDFFDKEKGSYDGRFTQFFDAIRKKHPELKLIATMKVESRTPDYVDEHYYRHPEEDMEAQAHMYDKRPRKAPYVFVGEWATRVGAPTPNLSGALGDSAWMTGMERNSDLVHLSCYAPLFVNVNKGAMQWPTDLIGYDALHSYGSPAYYAQKMFSLNHGDVVLPIDAANVPTKQWQPPGRKVKGVLQPPPPARTVETLFFNATRDTQSGVVYLKIVNTSGTAQPVHLQFSGVTSIENSGELVQMKGDSPDATNSITEPEKIVPVTSPLSGAGKDFTPTIPPYSISVLKLNAK
ncbi:MAG: alpha-L-arabinofuranosidase C-terminal domain-containing protein [Chthoniobacteraceae bacterium]